MQDRGRLQVEMKYEVYPSSNANHLAVFHIGVFEDFRKNKNFRDVFF